MLSLMGLSLVTCTVARLKAGPVENGGAAASPANLSQRYCHVLPAGRGDRLLPRPNL